MTSPDKTRSNKANAKKSTGPRTRDGKARASANAMTHGVLSRNLLLPDEDEAEWQELLTRLITELQPVGTLEQILVERIAVAAWRERRLIRVETARIQVAQRSGLSTRISVKGLVGEENARLINQILAGIGEEERLRLFEDLLAARSAKVSDPEVVKARYPHIWEKLALHSRPHGSVEAFLQKSYQGSLERYLAEMEQTQANILNAYERARIDKAADGLPAAPELFSRYQSALDNDLYKAMRALREAQRFRRESLEATAVVVSE